MTLSGSGTRVMPSSVANDHAKLSEQITHRRPIFGHGRISDKLSDVPDTLLASRLPPWRLPAPIIVSPMPADAATTANTWSAQASGSRAADSIVAETLADVARNRA